MEAAQWQLRQQRRAGVDASSSCAKNGRQRALQLPEKGSHIFLQETTSLLIFFYVFATPPDPHTPNHFRTHFV